eukprot:358053-Chlamydomonas_euryale.AAC.1
MRPFHALASCTRFMHPFHAPVPCARFMRSLHAPVSCARFMRPFHALASCARFMHPFHAPVSCACFMRPFHAHPFHAPLPCPVSCTRFMHPFYARPQSPITIHNQRTPVHIFPPLSIPVLSGAHTSIPIHTLPYPSIFFQAFPSSSTTVLTILLRAYLSIPGGGVATVWRRCGYGVACYRPCL